MYLRGIYKVKNGNKIITSKNSIQQDGFQLLRNWFVAKKDQNLKLIDLTQTAIVTKNNIGGGTIANSEDVFFGYKGTYSTVLDKSNAYYSIDFQENKKIKAIGIDILQTSNNNVNANIQIAYHSIAELQKIKDDFAIPVIYYEPASIQIQKDYNEKIFYFDQPLQTDRIKILFNNFHNNVINYRIYSIKIYEQEKLYWSPTHMTLWGENNNNLIRKPIQLKLSDSSRNSIIYKVNLQFDQLNSTDSVYAISTQFQDEENPSNWKQFSYSEFQSPWEQQAMQVIQLQYQLFLSNDGNISYSSQSNNSI